MEAAGTQLARSASLSPRLRRSRTTIRASPRMQKHAASPRLLRRATSDADDIARSAPAAATSPLPVLRDIVEEDVDGAGRGKGSDRSGRGGGRGGGGGGQGMHMDMGEYYRRVLRVESENPLVLRNYGRYLQEVEGDLAGAEECYARALLACPDDGDLLSLYGQVLWEARQDKERAAAYLERAVQAAPDDCYVLGSYASFLWDAEEDEEAAAADEKQLEQGGALGSTPPLVPAC
ncbi:hypothetical protein E2562_035402 [Oryza meyeriana var. granulata]|uniref:Uncharacterized protein n=1 Tax=Oryza meyeriana var. granulata TaxID=110450 RepID=A0A6G1F1W2_9ORYZ|nr:hypothetical protein E2562_035402 [Oryza meyeriana var. granulata]